jgi:hypothetical protein
VHSVEQRIFREQELRFSAACQGPPLQFIVIAAYWLLSLGTNLYFPSGLPRNLSVTVFWILCFPTQAFYFSPRLHHKLWRKILRTALPNWIENSLQLTRYELSVDDLKLDYLPGFVKKRNHPQETADVPQARSVSG